MSNLSDGFKMKDIWNEIENFEGTEFRIWTEFRNWKGFKHLSLDNQF